MSFLNEIRKFEPKSLRPTDVQVMTPDGRRFTETKCQLDGNYQVTNVLSSGIGFVGDTKPDLQVALVLPNLFIGSQDVAQDLTLMKSQGVTHILNCATGIPNFFPEEFQYLQINLLDLPETKIVEHFQESFKFIDFARESNCGKILIHCNAGVSRSATIVIGYLIQKFNMTFEDAYMKLKTVRASVKPNEGFIKQLKLYSEFIQADSHK